ncbi:hypothetical protein [Parerythrobacter jejuensis]|uniref:Ferrochelatase n=1 Tax=Parerythrobacter jejuensis TaxID=795812 RepID=A0A845APK1_9SPHN|nr:hypothetical protein [Parerythrobacter jejuensis]MXP32772.1 hypothetical protein [Parerythrobacter jejuensis]
MKLRNVLSGAAALSLLAAPVVSSAAPALARASAPVEGEELGGDNVIIGILVVAAAVAGVIIAAGSDNDSVSA